ncbi:hypothetical protein D3C81_767510 [compost metagenome]
MVTVSVWLSAGVLLLKPLTISIVTGIIISLPLLHKTFKLKPSTLNESLIRYSFLTTVESSITSTFVMSSGDSSAQCAFNTRSFVTISFAKFHF